MPTDTMESRPHPDSLFERSTLKLAYCDLLAELAKEHPEVVAAAARALEADAAALRSMNPGSGFTSPGAFLARAWVARSHPTDVEGVHESQAREAASRFLNGQVAELRERSPDGLVFAYVPASHVADLAPPQVRVRPVESGRRVAVELLDPEDGTPTCVGTPALEPAQWNSARGPRSAASET